MSSQQGAPDGCPNRESDLRDSHLGNASLKASAKHRNMPEK